MQLLTSLVAYFFDEVDNDIDVVEIVIVKLLFMDDQRSNACSTKWFRYRGIFITVPAWQCLQQ